MMTIMSDDHNQGEAIVDPADFRTATGFLLSQLGVVAARSWLSVLAERGLTAHQHGVLLTLRGASPLTLSELSRAVLVDPRNMSAVLDPLDAAGLLARGVGADDRRQRMLSLTDAGKRAADGLAAATAAIEDRFLQPLDGADRRALQRLLLRLWAHHSG